MLRFIRKFARDARGASAMLFAMSLPLLAVVVALAMDYSNASLQHTRLNAIADSAVLAGLTPDMLQQPFAVGQAAARQAFLSQAAGVSTIVPGSLQVTVIPNNPNNNAYARQITIKYIAQARNFISGVFAPQTTYVEGSSTATAGMPPNIDFYLLLDNSPSMSLPADQNGINLMIDLTSAQAGCAFACHQASTGNSDTAGNPYYNPNNAAQACTGPAGGGQNPGCVQMDNYALARANSITLRLDELTAAIGDLMQTAKNSQIGSLPPVYRFSVNSMDSSYTIGFTNVMAQTADYISGWASAAGNFAVMEMFSNDKSCVPVTVNNVTTCTQGSTPDVATNYDDSLSNLNALLPVAGQGTNQPGDTPQEILFFVTDGVEDENSGGIRLIQQINAGTAHNYCADIKSRGIKIAILYTEYLPVPVNSFYVGNVEPFQPQIGPALKDCASSGLFYDAEIGADLGKALSTLFQAAVQSATLTH
jgi:Flp pilus assembly protein TadG